MDLDYKVLNLYRSRRYDQCIQVCCDNPGEEIIQQILKMRAMTIQAKVAGSHYDETDYLGADDTSLVDGGLAKTARPGTTFQRAHPKSSNITGMRGVAATARARTGTARPVRTALATAARAARAATALHVAGAAAGGSSWGAGGAADSAVALGVIASDQLTSPAYGKTLFEYVFYSEGDVRKAMEIVLQTQSARDSADWWWQHSLAKCYIALGMTRNAEECLRLALDHNKHIAIYLRLIAMYVGLKQPLSALQVCKSARALHPNDAAVHLEEARIHEAMGNAALAITEYRNVAVHDANNMEAIANIAYYNFYNDQPEIALRYYRRLLATTPANPELFNNLGLCCLACNQLDLVLPCFRQALFLATSTDTRAEIWFNLAHVALTAGDLTLAQRCLQASLSMQSDYKPALDTFKKLKNFLKKRPQPNLQ